MKKRQVGIHWRDLHAYSDNERCEPTQAYTEGALVRSRANYVLIQNPETIVLNPLRNHPQKRPNFYYIPRALIVTMEFID